MACIPPQMLRAKRCLFGVVWEKGVGEGRMSPYPVGDVGKELKKLLELPDGTIAIWIDFDSDALLRLYLLGNPLLCIILAIISDSTTRLHFTYFHQCPAPATTDITGGTSLMP